MVVRNLVMGQAIVKGFLFLFDFKLDIQVNAIADDNGRFIIMECII